MLNRRRFHILLVACASGCGLPAPPAAPGPAAIIVDGPLDDAGVQRFLQIVARLPEGKPPEFQPVAELDLTTDSNAADKVGRWKQEFRSAYQPLVQARLWKRDSRLREALAECDVQPEDFAALLVTMSAAVVRESLPARLDLPALGRQAERAIESYSAQLDALDTDPRWSPSVRNGRSEFLSMVLREAVAYREFLRLLESVPQESIAAVAGHRETLRSLMPATETVRAFEAKLRSQPAVIQAGHDSPEGRPVP